jgi:hypothetical protein
MGTIGSGLPRRVFNRVFFLGLPLFISGLTSSGCRTVRSGKNWGALGDLTWGKYGFRLVKLQPGARGVIGVQVRIDTNRVRTITLGKFNSNERSSAGLHEETLQFTVPFGVIDEGGFCQKRTVGPVRKNRDGDSYVVDVDVEYKSRRTGESLCLEWPVTLEGDGFSIE